VQIAVLTVPDCPHRDETLRRVRQALDVSGRAAVVVEQVISDPGEAAAAGMRGSPTILIDGHDPFATPADEPSFSCRLFRTGSGLDGAPAVDDLVDALR
jgi:hypothetical protein